MPMVADLERGHHGGEVSTGNQDMQSYTEVIRMKITVSAAAASILYAPADRSFSPRLN